MKIAVVPGDGIGREVTAQATKVLRAVLGRLPCDMQEVPAGAAAFEACGDPLPESTLKAVREVDAVLFGATGGLPEGKARARHQPTGGVLLRLRKEMNLFANFRPALMFPELISASTLKPEVVEGLDLIILRELGGDVYYGQPRGISTNAFGERTAFNTMCYSEPEVERIGHAAFKTARMRRRKVCSVDKANVLETSVLWRETMIRVGADYPDVELSHLYVDAAAMTLMRDPKRFDIIVTGNLFGDILSDEAAMLTGSIGMLPSASLGHGHQGLYEPVHGSAPDIAGKDRANPLASILSAAMMLRYSFGMGERATAIENAVRCVLREGYRTPDLIQPNTTQVGTEEMGDLVAKAVGYQVALMPRSADQTTPSSNSAPA